VDFGAVNAVSLEAVLRHYPNDPEGKTVIGSRLKQSGMFWAVRGPNAIIALRCCHLNRRPI